jgi:hypothetical protein
VYESDFSIHKTAHEHIFRIRYRLKDSEDLMALGMRPPASPDWLAGNRLCKSGNRAFGRRKDYAMLFNKGDRFVGCHVAPRCAQRQNVVTLTPSALASSARFATWHRVLLFSIRTSRRAKTTSRRCPLRPP